jgi:PhzF family phenazine biosynthesis protein
MRLPFYQADAFTNELFRGNPAGVVMLDEELPEATMQSIAAENNVSETAFVIRGVEPLRLRWFTPKIEVDLCGHATLATACVLFKRKRAGDDALTFTSQSGLLTVVRDGDDLMMDFPARQGTPVAASDELVAALGARPGEVVSSNSLMAVFETQADVAALRPDFEKIKALDALGVIATAPGDDADFVSRFFVPKTGIPEDPVTGSTHTTLTPYWSERLGKKSLRALQISERGGEILCEDRGERVGIGGRVVIYLVGEIEVGGTPGCHGPDA